MAIQEASTLAQFGFVAIGLGLFLLIMGFTAIQRHNRKAHMWFMLFAVMVDGIFLILYVARYLIEGNVPFTGSKFLFNFVYLPILSVHILTAVVSIFFVLRQTVTGYRGRKYNENGSLILEGEYRTSHKKFGKIAVYIWGSSFIGGIIVFILLYLI